MLDHISFCCYVSLVLEVSLVNLLVQQGGAGQDQHAQRALNHSDWLNRGNKQQLAVRICAISQSSALLEALCQFWVPFSQAMRKY